MSNIRSQLTEQIVVLTIYNDRATGALSYEKYKECCKARAKIQQAGCAPDGKKIYNIEFFLPSARLKNIPFAGILWNGEEYLFMSPFKTKNCVISGLVKSVL